MLPSLIVVTGAPGSGKSRRAAARRSSAAPLIAKDDIKEALWKHVGAGDRDRFLEYERASYPLMLLIARLLLVAGKSAVVEANFTPDWAANELARLQAETPVSLHPGRMSRRRRDLSHTLSGAQRFRPSSPDASGGGDETEISFEERLRNGLWDQPIPFGGNTILLDTNDPFDMAVLAEEIASLVTAA